MPNLFKLLIGVLISLFFVNTYSSNVVSDSIKIKTFEQHVKSLDYISRKTSNNKLYLNLAKSYCDSILKFDSKNTFANKFKDKIDLTLSANELNMNHKIQLFDLFSGFPPYMGFADDPIEYAYDDAINDLLLTREIDFQKGPLGQSKIPSIIVRKNCDDEMFEIANQIIIENTTHYIIPKHEIESIIGSENANTLIDGSIDESFLDAISNKLNVNRIGIFEMNDLDVINDRIWYVQSSFYAYSPGSGFTQTIFTRGFNHDKRDLSIINILLLLLESLILISIISFIDQNKKIRKIFNDKIEFSVKWKKFLELFINKIIHVLICFIIPLIFSFAMIYAVSNLIPNPEGDFREASSRIWLISLTLGMSLFPTLLNLIMVNRLDLDGFHTIKGYRLFFNTSLYTTYFPIFIFYIIKFESIPRIEHILLVLVTFTISWLLSKSYYRFTANSIHKNLKVQAVIGMIMAIISLLLLNQFILSDLTYINLIYGFGIAFGLALVYEIIDKRIQKINILKEQTSSEQNLIEKDIYIDNVLNPDTMIYQKIKDSMDDNSLNIMILSAPMGIGKTVSLKQAADRFIKNPDWDYYYGDCDEVQDEGAISFEPFLEAFGKLLKIDKFSNRGDNIEQMKDSTVALAGTVGVNTDIVTDFERDQQKSMTETCIEIIDKLEDVDKKMVFVLEDLHWVDPETYSFLKHFIQLVNNNEFLRRSICVVLSLRNGNNSEYRGVSYDKLMKDLEDINENEDFKFDVENLFDFKKSVNLKDFVKYLSDQDNAFKIQSYSMNQINNLFNIRESENRNDEYSFLTPLYVRKSIEGWIEDETLKYSPDGYLLTRTLSADDLPNSDEVDKYYHSIFDTYDEKWQRLLESAAIIGNRFDAEILAKVWGYELLDILSFLEKAVNHDLLIDLSAEDNMYKFYDKRIVSAIKSYFKISNKIEGDKQIVIEYNKRYIALQNNIIEKSNLYSVEDLLKVCRRLVTLISNDIYKVQAQNLILEIVIRFITSNEFDKLNAFSSFLKSMKMNRVSFVIDILNSVSNPHTITELSEQNIAKIYPLDKDNNPLIFSPKTDFEKELVLICCIYHDPDIIIDDDLQIIDNYLTNKYKGDILFYLSYNLYDCIIENRSEKFKKFDDLIISLKDSHNYNLFCHIISVAKISEKRDYLSSGINDTWSDVYPKPSINTLKSEYLAVYDTLIEFNDLSVIFLLSKSYIGFLSNQLRKRQDAIDFYLKTISIFESNENSIVETVKLKMYIVTILCRKKFINQYPDVAKSDFDFIESYVGKRYNKKSYNHFLYDYYRYKMMYFQVTENYSAMRDVGLFHLKLMKSNIGEKRFGYAHGCNHYANALSYLGEGKKAIKWYEKSIAIRKSLLKKSEYQILRIPHNNLVHDYMKLDPKNHKKILIHAKAALDLAIVTDIDHYIALKTYAKALYHTGDSKKSYNFYKKSFESLSSVDIDDKQEHLSDLRLDMALVYADININEAIPMLKNALNNAYDPDLLYKNQVELAKKILKNNKK